MEGDEVDCKLHALEVVVVECKLLVLEMSKVVGRLVGGMKFKFRSDSVSAAEDEGNCVSGDGSLVLGDGGGLLCWLFSSN